MTADEALIPAAEASPEGRHARADGPIHEWFGLSYNNYQVLHRTLMQSMPVQWQERMVACLEELREAFDHVEQAPGYEVRACEWRAPSDLSSHELAERGISAPDEDGLEYYDRDGHQLDPYSPSLAVPGEDPTPHYDRGRTFIEPRLVS